MQIVEYRNNRKDNPETKPRLGFHQPRVWVKNPQQKVLGFPTESHQSSKATKGIRQARNNTEESQEKGY